MAIRTTGVRYDIIGRDNASRAFSSAGRSASRLERGLGKLGRAAKLATVALGAGIAAGLAEGTKKAVEFQAEMLKIQTQAGASAKDVKTLSAQVLELGKTAEQGPQQLSEALYHLKSVGMDNVSAMKALKTASDLAAVGGSDLEETTNALAGAWRTGIKGATSMKTAAQTLNATIGAGNMTMEDMVAALGTGILPTAKTFGLTLSQVGAALALFTDEGVDSASAATRLRMSISLLGAPSKAAEKQLKRIGLSGHQLGQAMRGPDGIIGAITLLKKRLDASGLSATDSAALLSHAFGGGKSSSAILSMVNNLDVLKKKQVQVNDSMGRYGPAVQAQRKTAAAQLKIIESNLEVFAIKTGNVLLPPFTAMVTYITKTALPAVHGFGHELATKLVPVDTIKHQLTTISTGVSDFFAGFKPKGKKAKVRVPAPQVEGPTIPKLLRKPYVFKTPAPQITSPAAKIPSLIARPKKQESQAKQFGQNLRKLLSGGIGDAIKNAAKNTDWGKLGRQIGSGLGTAIGWVGKHISDLSKKMIKALSKLDYVDIGKSFGKMAIPLAIGIITSLFDPLFTADFWREHWLDTIIAVISVVPIGRVGGALAKIFTKIPVLKMFAPFLERVGGLGRLVEKPLGKILKGVWAVAKGIGRGFIEGFDRIFPEASRVLRGKLDDLSLKIFGFAARIGVAGQRIVTGLKNGIIAGAEGLGKIIGRIVGYVLKPFARSGSWLLTKGSLVVRGLRTGITTGAARLGSWVFDHVIRPVTGAFAGAGGWLVGKGRALVRGLLSGIGKGAVGVGKWLSTHLVKPVINWVKSLFGIHSPSTVFIGIGRNVVAGLLAGIAAAALAIGKWVRSRLVSPVLAVFNGAGGWLLERGKSIVSGLKSGVLDTAKGLGKWAVSHVVDPIKDEFAGAGAWLYQHGVDLMHGLLSGIKQGFKGVSGYLGSTVKGALKGVGGAFGKIPGFASGGVAPVGTTAWVGERGPELMQVTPNGVRIFSNPQSVAMAPRLGDHLPGYASGTGGTAAARVSAAQRKVTAAQASVDAWRRRESAAHTRRQKHIDSLNLQAAQRRLSAAKAQLAAAKKHQTTVTSVANSLANGFARSLETGTASAIASAVKSMNTKLQGAGGGSLVAGNNRTSARLQALANQRALLQAKVKSAQGYATDQAGSLGDYLGVGGTSGRTVSDLIIEMRQSQSTARKFAAEVSHLSKMGLSKTLLSQLADAGPGSQLAAVLKGASAFDVRNLNALAASQNKLTTSYGRTLADAMYDAGSQAGRGFLTGLTAQETAIQAEMNHLADGMVRTIKRRLGIHSPSRVLRDQVGKQVAMGAAAGVRAYGVHAVRETQRMADLMGAVRVRSGAGAPAQGGGVQVARLVAAAVLAAGNRPITGEVYLDSGELLGVMRGQARPVAQAEVERFARDLMAAAANTGG